MVFHLKEKTKILHLIYCNIFSFKKRKWEVPLDSLRNDQVMNATTKNVNLFVPVALCPYRATKVPAQLARGHLFSSRLYLPAVFKSSLTCAVWAVTAKRNMSY